MNPTFRNLLLLSSLCALTACDSLRAQLGTPQSPDEFAVIRRAPLERPPEYKDASSLPVPVRGKARPQEMAPVKQAEKALIRTSQQTQPTAVQASYNQEGVDELLSKAGAHNVDPTIRNTIEAEHYKLQQEELATIDRLIGKVINKQPPSKIVDAKAEFERLKKNQAEGKPVTEGETPTISTE